MDGIMARKIVITSDGGGKDRDRKPPGSARFRGSRGAYGRDIGLNVDVALGIENRCYTSLMS